MPFLPFIPFPDGAEVLMRFVQQGVPWFLTFGFVRAGPNSLIDLQNLVTAMDLWWTNQLSPQISGNCSLVDFKATDLTSVSSPTWSAPPATVPAGTLAGSVLPAQNALVVTMDTALRGRSYRGRNYVAGRVAGDEQTVTTWTAARVAAVRAAYNNLPGIVSPTGWIHNVLSRQNANVRRTTGVATPILSYTAKVQIATQRGRLL